MADVASRLAGPTQLSASATTIYTVPGATTATILHIVVCNTTTGPVSVYLSIGADAAGTRLWHNQPVVGILELKGFIVLTAAQILQAYASAASSATITVNGVLTT